MGAIQYLELATTGLETIDQIEETTTPKDVLSVYFGFVQNYGFTSVAMCQLANPHLLQDPASQIFISTWSEEWGQHWWTSGYMEHDPVIQYLLKTRKPFSWDTAYRHASKFGRKIIDESREYGFTNGIAFPITTGTGPLGCASLGCDDIPEDPKVLAMIELVSISCYMHLVKIKGLSSEYGLGHLSKRETEVMHFVAEGKTNWEIATILGLSEESVKAYLKNISKKLDTVNRAHSVSTAIRKGLIIP